MNKSDIDKVLEKSIRKSEKDWPRSWLAVIVVSFGYVVIFVLGIINNKSENVINSIIALVAAWSGAVVAFYFSQKNVDSANRTLNQLVEKISPEQRLSSTPVVACMIPFNQMDLLTNGENVGNLKIKDDIIKKMDDTHQNRLPVLNQINCVKLIIHKSMIDSYLAEQYKIMQSKSQQIKKDYQHLTIKDLCVDKDNEHIWKTISKGMTFVRPSATMSEAKREMEQTKNCLDVFVTENGKSDGEIIGWITNSIITECAFS